MAALHSRGFRGGARALSPPPPPPSLSLSQKKQVKQEKQAKQNRPRSPPPSLPPPFTLARGLDPPLLQTFPLEMLFRQKRRAVVISLMDGIIQRNFDLSFLDRYQRMYKRGMRRERTLHQLPWDLVL